VFLVSLRLRLLGLFLVLVVVVVGSALATGVALSKVEAERDVVANRWQPASVQSRALLTSLVNQETGQRGYVLTGDEAFLEPYRNGGLAFRDTLESLQHRFADDEEMSQALAAVSKAATRWQRGAAAPEIEGRRSGELGPARQLLLARRGKTYFDDVRVDVTRLQQLIDTRADEAATREADDIDTLRTTVLIGRVVIVAFVVIVALLLRGWVLGPVSRLRARMREVAGGQLDRQVLVSGPPEVMEIAQDAENMRRRIVSELDATREATEALSQHSPVVMALRRELAPRPRAESGGLQVTGMVQAAEGVLAGDWWEAVARPDGTTALVLADVSGHGAEAGLVAYAFKQRITALLEGGLDLSTIFTLVARRPHGGDDERFLSCLVVVVDPRREQVSWINAGHPPALVVNRDRGGAVRELAPTGPLISSVTSGWRETSAPFRPGDLLVACTDGVLEARNAQGDEFGLDGVLGVLRGLRSWSPDDAVSECHQAVRRFAVDSRRDDVTCVALSMATSNNFA
jgi:serine phosphatase RsbU (regulator of sigma subunit)/CHASE3 domain sensor protein